MADESKTAKGADSASGGKPGQPKSDAQQQADAEAMQSPVTLGTSHEPPYPRTPEADLPPAQQSGNITTREMEMARAKEAGVPLVAPVAEGTRPGESSDPAVHQILGDMQAARDAGDTVSVDRLNDRLREAGYTV